MAGLSKRCAFFLGKRSALFSFNFTQFRTTGSNNNVTPIENALQRYRYPRRKLRNQS